MKKKGPRSIPDFSTKRPGTPVPENALLPKIHPAQPAPVPGAKPHATSKKSGRRGS